MTGEFTDKRELDNIYEKVRKSIKEKIEAKGISCKGTAKGNALSEIMSVFDDELGLDIAQELVEGRKTIRQYYEKYRDVEHLEHKYQENEKKLKEQNKLVDTVSLLTDEVLKNAIVAYNIIKTSSVSSNDAKEIAIKYITSKGREDLKDVITLEEYIPMSVITKFKEKVMNLKGDNFANDYYIKILDECIKEHKSNL